MLYLITAVLKDFSLEVYLSKLFPPSIHFLLKSWLVSREGMRWVKMIYAGGRQGRVEKWMILARTVTYHWKPAFSCMISEKVLTLNIWIKIQILVLYKKKWMVKMFHDDIIVSIYFCLVTFKNRNCHPINIWWKWWAKISYEAESMSDA